MKECMDFLEKSDDAHLALAEEADLDEIDEGREAAWEDLDSLVSSIDNANDLVPTNIWPRLVRFIRQEHGDTFQRIAPTMQEGALTVTATAIANNPKANTAVSSPLLKEQSQRLKMHSYSYKTTFRCPNGSH